MTKEIRHGDVTLYTESFGSPENPTILLIMGATSSMIWWDEPFCQLLVDKGFHVIRYDNRDTGKSTCYPPGEPGYTFEELADDAIHVLDGYGIDKAVVMGMSMGGMLTQMIALRHPDRLNGIVLLSTMYFAEGADQLPVWSDDVGAFFENFGAQKEPETEEELLEYAIRHWKVVASGSTRSHDEAHIREMNRLDIQRANRFESRVNHSYAQVTGDELMRIGEIDLPTLVIHGTNDAVISYEHAQMLEKTIAGAELLTLDGAGHELHPDDYETVADKIADMFLKSKKRCL